LEPPPISFLRHPRVFEVLLQGLFNPGRQLPPETAQAYCGLLALAAAADDRRPAGPADSHAPADVDSNGDLAHDAADAGGLGGHSSPGGGGSSGGSEGLDLSAVPATRAALEAAAELAQRVLGDARAGQEALDRAAAVLEYPCCAAGGVL
jgi:hypothetical protein